MLIKIVNPDNKDEVCVYGTVVNCRISTKGGTPDNIDKFMDKHKALSDQFINENSSKPVRRIFFNMMGEYFEVFTNWKIYLMNSDGQTIESL